MGEFIGDRYVSDGEVGLRKLIGQQVKEVWMNEENLQFVTADAVLDFYVEGDCCSHSYFFDFYGVDLLLKFPVVDVEEVDLSPGDPGYLPPGYEKGYESIQVYGYRITVEDPKLGNRSAVFSFRNSSNGYYGGWLVPRDYVHKGESLPMFAPEERLTGDKVG